MAAFDFAKVKDPTFFKENVLNAHASFRTYASVSYTHLTLPTTPYV